MASFMSPVESTGSLESLTLSESETSAKTAAPPSETTPPYQPQSNSRLLSLPRELRDEIWSYTLITDIIDQNNKPIQYIDASLHFYPAILQTSRQVRTEASPLYFTNTLFLDTSYDDPPYIETLEIPVDYINTIKWLKSLPSTKRRQIKFIGLVDFHEWRLGSGPRILPREGMLDRWTRETCKAIEALDVSRGAVRFLDGYGEDEGTGVGELAVAQPIWDENRWEMVGMLKLRKRGEKEQSGDEDESVD